MGNNIAKGFPQSAKARRTRSCQPHGGYIEFGIGKLDDAVADSPVAPAPLHTKTTGHGTTLSANNSNKKFPSQSCMYCTAACSKCHTK